MIKLTLVHNVNRSRKCLEFLGQRYVHCLCQWMLSNSPQTVMRQFAHPLTVSENICDCRPLEYRYRVVLYLSPLPLLSHCGSVGQLVTLGLCPPEFSFWSSWFTASAHPGLSHPSRQGITATRLRRCSQPLLSSNSPGSPTMSAAVSSSPLSRTVFTASKPSPTVWVPAGARPGELKVAPWPASPAQHSSRDGRGGKEPRGSGKALAERADHALLSPGEEINLTFTVINVIGLGEAVGLFRGKETGIAKNTGFGAARAWI